MFTVRANIITERIQIEQSDKRKRNYKVNLSTAVRNMRLWLRKVIATDELVKRKKISNPSKTGQKISAQSEA